MNLHVYIIYIILLIKQSYTFIQLYIFLYHIIVSNHVISDRFFRLNWLYLYHICCGCSRTVEGMHWLTNPNLRSKDYGSPNARRRVYIVGARVDVCNGKFSNDGQLHQDRLPGSPPTSEPFGLSLANGCVAVRCSSIHVRSRWETPKTLLSTANCKQLVSLIIPMSTKVT